jgi:hypothetical protein
MLPLLRMRAQTTRTWPPIRYVALSVLIGLAWALASGSPPIVRQKIVNDPVQVERDLTLKVQAAPGSDAPWTVVVLRAASRGNDDATVRVLGNGRVLATLVVRPDAHRFDVVVPRTEPLVSLQLACDGPWRLDSLEVSTVHGHSRGLLSLVILPADGPHRGSWLVALGLVVALLMLSAAGPRPFATRAARRLHSVATGVTVVFLTAVVLSPALSAFRVVVSPRSLLLCALVIFVAPVRQQIDSLWRTLGRNRPERAEHVALICGVVAVALCFGLILADAIRDAAGNESALLHFSRRFADGAPMLAERPELRRSLVVKEEGYDGQFYYYMAFDPLLRRFAADPSTYRAYIDNPPYRYGRIAFSALVWVVSLGRPDRFPSVMVWLLPLANGVVALFVGFWILRRRGSLIWMAACAVNVGLIASMLSGLPEAVAAALLLGGIYYWDRRSLGTAAVYLGAALTVRETGALLLAALIVFEAVRRRNWRGAATLAAAVLPVVAWRTYMCWQLFPSEGLGGFWANPHDLTFPFVGVFELWRNLSATPYGASGIVFPLLLLAGGILALWSATDRFEPLGLAAAGYALLGLSLNYEKIWHHLGSAERGSFELWILLTLLASSVPASAPRRRLAYRALFVSLAAYTFFLAPEAASARAGLLLFE